MKCSFYLFSLILLFSCQQGAVSTGNSINLEGFETSTIQGTNIIKATKKNSGGTIIEEGYVSNGLQNGTWVTYYEGGDNGKFKTMASYCDGILSGPFLSFSNRGQIETEVQYQNNMYNGRYASFKFGRLEKEAHYKDNKLHGSTKDFDNKGNVKKEINYKNGEQDGLMRYFDEEGNVTVEYVYQNGKKLSGGMIKK